MENTAYCPACGTTVPIIEVTLGRGVSAVEVPRCGQCGFIFKGKPKAAPPAPLTAPTGGGPMFQRVAIADDLTQVREALAQDLLQFGLVGEVQQFENGATVAAAIQSKSNTGPPFDLYILDIEMPFFDGLKAAGLLRAVEKQEGWRGAPVLFLTSLQCDEGLRNKMDALFPAIYYNKSSVGGRHNLGARLAAVLNAIRLQYLASSAA